MTGSPSTIWSITLAATFLAWLLVPGGRFLLSVLLFLHAAVLAWGVCDLRSGFFLHALISAKKGAGRLALTFDDGPDPHFTPEILDLLGRYGFTVTFFVIGSRARQFPDIARRIHREGHLLGCHDLDHRWSANFRRRRALSRDIAEACAAIRAVTGAVPLLYRPPAGLVNPHTAKVLAQRAMRCIGWSARAGEAGNRRRDRLERIPVLASDGAVILLHDCLPRPELKAELLRALDRLFAEIRDSRLEAVGVDRLFGIRAYG